MICKIINLSDFYSHHCAEIALANAPLTFSLTNSLDILPSSLPYLNFILNLQFFSYSILLQVIYTSHKVLDYAAVITPTSLWFLTRLFIPHLHKPGSSLHHCTSGPKLMEKLLCVAFVSHYGRKRGEFGDRHPAPEATAQT